MASNSPPAAGFDTQPRHHLRERDHVDYADVQSDVELDQESVGQSDEEADEEPAKPSTTKSRTQKRNGKGKEKETQEEEDREKAVEEIDDREYLFAREDLGDTAEDPAYSGPPRNSVWAYESGSRKTPHTAMRNEEIPLVGETDTLRRRRVTTTHDTNNVVERTELMYSILCFDKMSAKLKAELRKKAKGQPTLSLRSELTKRTITRYEVLRQATALCGSEQKVKAAKENIARWIPLQRQTLHENSFDAIYRAVVKYSCVRDTPLEIDTRGNDTHERPSMSPLWKFCMEVLQVVKAAESEAWIESESHVEEVQTILGSNKDPQGWSVIKKTIKSLEESITIAEYRQGHELVDRVKIALSTPCPALTSVAPSKFFEPLIRDLEDFKDRNTDSPAFRYPLWSIIRLLKADKPLPNGWSRDALESMTMAITSMEDIFEERASQMDAVMSLKEKVVSGRILHSNWTSGQYSAAAEHVQSIGKINQQHSIRWYLDQFSPRIAELEEQLGNLDLDRVVSKSSSEKDALNAYSSSHIEPAVPVEQMSVVDKSQNNPHMIFMEVEKTPEMTIERLTMQMANILLINGFDVALFTAEATPASIVMFLPDTPGLRGSLKEFSERATGLSEILTCYIRGVRFRLWHNLANWPLQISDVDPEIIKGVRQPRAASVWESRPEIVSPARSHPRPTGQDNPMTTDQLGMAKGKQSSRNREAGKTQVKGKQNSGNREAGKTEVREVQETLENTSEEGTKIGNEGNISEEAGVDPKAAPAPPDAEQYRIPKRQGSINDQAPKSQQLQASHTKEAPTPPEVEPYRIPKRQGSIKDRAPQSQQVQAKKRNLGHPQPLFSKKKSQLLDNGAESTTDDPYKERRGPERGTRPDLDSSLRDRDQHDSFARDRNESLGRRDVSFDQPRRVSDSYGRNRSRGNWEDQRRNDSSNRRFADQGPQNRQSGARQYDRAEGPRDFRHDQDRRRSRSPRRRSRSPRGQQERRYSPGPSRSAGRYPEPRNSRSYTDFNSSSSRGRQVNEDKAKNIGDLY